MRLKTALAAFVLLFCPCALCYGQLSFSSVHGERGYTAMRGTYRYDMDNGVLLVPQFGYYRMSDKEIDEAGSVSRYGLLGSYDFNDKYRVLARGFWQPEAVGYHAVTYALGGQWSPFYRYGLITEPTLRLWAGQARHRSYVDRQGADLPNGAFSNIETFTEIEGTANIKNWKLRAQWHKVIKYNKHAPQEVTFSWADIPYMTAVIEGFIEDSAGAWVYYGTDFISPYLSAARYHYAQRKQAALAVSAGLHVRVGEVTSLVGGVEVFEPRREENRKTFFSFSAEMEF